jgi:hypothetical protein
MGLAQNHNLVGLESGPDPALTETRTVMSVPTFSSAANFQRSFYFLFLQLISFFPRQEIFQRMCSSCSKTFRSVCSKTFCSKMDRSNCPKAYCCYCSKKFGTFVRKRFVIFARKCFVVVVVKKTVVCNLLYRRLEQASFFST